MGITRYTEWKCDRCKRELRLDQTLRGSEQPEGWSTVMIIRPPRAMPDRCNDLCRSVVLCTDCTGRIERDLDLKCDVAVDGVG